MHGPVQVQTVPTAAHRRVLDVAVAIQLYPVHLRRWQRAQLGQQTTEDAALPRLSVPQNGKVQVRQRIRHRLLCLFRMIQQQSPIILS